MGLSNRNYQLTKEGELHGGLHYSRKKAVLMPTHALSLKTKKPTRKVTARVSLETGKLVFL